jgi:hypothetical protein
MANFGEVAKGQKAPLATMVLPPSAFSPAWPDAPTEPVCVGLTLLSDGDAERALPAAMAEAWQVFPRVEDQPLRYAAAEDILLRYIVARGTTDPNDVSEPPELWSEAPEDIVKHALTIEGVRAIFDALERLRLSTSPAMLEATDEQIALLPNMTKGLNVIPTWRAVRVRRLLAFCLGELVDAG